MDNAEVVTFDTYQSEVRDTSGHFDDPIQSLTAYAMGLAEETGEIVGLLKKHQFNGAGLDLSRFGEEIGDALWYLTALANSAGLSMEVLAIQNLEKLRVRYPGGFDAATEAGGPKGDA